jgi:hypothetical protein
MMKILLLLSLLFFRSSIEAQELGTTTSTTTSNTQTEIVTETTVIENTPTLTETIITAIPTNTETDREFDSNSDSEEDDDNDSVSASDSDSDSEEDDDNDSVSASDSDSDSEEDDDNGGTGGQETGSTSSLNSELNFLDQGSSIRQLWIWHGVLMAVSWGILMPLAIGSSMLRETLCLPPGLWLKLHYSLNMFAIACMIVSFAIAVHAYNANTAAGEDPKHFDDLKHRTIGLVIFLIVFLQAASGFMRPNVPKKPATPVETPKDVEATIANMNELEDFETTNSSNSTSEDEEVSSNPKESVKSTARRIWEYKHRIMGLGLLGLSWYNCDSGLKLYAERYGEDYDLLGAFWGVTGGLSGLICILYALQIARR